MRIGGGMGGICDDGGGIVALSETRSGAPGHARPPFSPCQLNNIIYLPIVD